MLVGTPAVIRLSGLPYAPVALPSRVGLKRELLTFRHFYAPLRI